MSPVIDLCEDSSDDDGESPQRRKRMSLVFDLREDSSDDDGESQHTASVPPLPLSRKRHRDNEESSDVAHPCNKIGGKTATGSGEFVFDLELADGMDNEESSNDAHPCDKNSGPGRKTATGSAEFVFDLELADEVEDVSPHIKRRVAMISDRNSKHDATGDRAQILKEVHPAEEDVGGEDAQAMDHHDSHEGFAAVTSHPMNSDLEETSREGGSANKHPHKLSTSRLSLNESGRNRGYSTWEDSLSELVAYRKIHGHCNVPNSYTKLGWWISTQRKHYSLYQEGKTSSMTLSRIQALESLGVAPRVVVVVPVPVPVAVAVAVAELEQELPAPVLEPEPESTELQEQETETETSPDNPGQETNTQEPLSEEESTPEEDAIEEQAEERVQRRESHEGFAADALHPMNSDSDETSHEDASTNKCFQKVWTSKLPRNESQRQGRYLTWEDRLSALVDYRKIHGHCNVPSNYSENSKLASWVKAQRTNYSLYQEGKTSAVTLSQIRELESLGFKWSSSSAGWEERLNELADYREIHGHCNVPKNYSDNAKLGHWVAYQRTQYKLQQEGKSSYMTPFRIQELESMGFQWERFCAASDDRLSELADYRKIHGHCNVPRNYSENSKLASWVENQRYLYKLQGEASPMTLSRIQALESLGFEWDCYWEDRLNELADYREIHGHCNVPKNYSDNTKLGHWVAYQRTQYKLQQEGKSSYMTPFRIQELESMGFQWERFCAASDDRLSELADYRKIHGHCNVPRNYIENSKLATWVEEQRYLYGLQGKASSITLSRIQALESLGFEWDSRGAACERRFIEFTGCRKIHKHCNVPKNCSKNSKMSNAGGRPIRNFVQSTADKLANPTQDMQQTPPDKDFKSDNVLNEIEVELIWLGEESMYGLSCPEFQFDFIHEYASPALKVELRKLSRHDQSETEKLKQIVRMEDWMVSGRFDFVRNHIRMMLGRGFRRHRMRIVIAELRLLRGQQSKRKFPAMILARNKSAPAKAVASTVIEQVDVDTLKVIATFPSQKKAERQTGIRRTNIHRGLRQGRPLGGYFWRSVRTQSS
jgi:hypothetical protein